MTYDFLRPRAQEMLVARILNADICVSDLDYTDADSPAKKLVMDIFHFAGLKYINWVKRTGRGRVSDGQQADSKYWKEFIELFLREPKELEFIKRKFSEEKAKASLYHGVEEFYNLLPAQSEKVYITRNIREVAQAYAGVLNINLIIAEAFDKRKAVEKLFSERNYKNWLIKGDSDEDAETFDFLKFHKRMRKIEDVVGIYICGDSYNHKFDVNIPPDYTRLVEAMKRFGK